MKDLELKITTKVDYASLASGNQKLKEFLTTLTQVNNALNGRPVAGTGSSPMTAGAGGMNGGGGNKGGGNNALTKGIAENAMVLSKTISQAKDSFGKLKDITANVTSVQIKNLKDLANQANTTSNALAKLGSSMRSTGGGGGMGGNGGGGNGGNNGRWTMGNPMPPFIGGNYTMGGGGGGAGGIVPGPYPYGGGGGGSAGLNYGKMQTWGGGMSALGGSAQNIAAIMQNAKTDELQYASQSGAFGKYMIGASLQGRLSPWSILSQGNNNKINGDGFSDKLMQGADRGASRLGIMGSAAAHVGGLVTGAVDMLAGNSGGGRGVPGTAAGAGRVADSTGGIVSDVRKGIFGGPDAEAAQTQVSQMQLMEEQNPVTEAMFSQLNQMAGLRVSSSKALQGKHFSAFGIGGGYGLAPGEAAGAFGSAVRTGGMAQAFGGTETYLAPSHRIGRDRSRVSVDFSGEERTRKSRGSGQLSMEMEAMGMDRGASLSMISRMGDAASGPREQASEKAFSNLGEIMAIGVKKGLDARFFEEIGSEMGEAAVTRIGGKSEGREYGRLLMTGLGSQSSMTDVRANVDAMKGFNQFSQTNAFQQASRARISAQVLGSGASGMSMGLAQRADVSDLLNGSKFLDNIGISKGQGQKILKGQFNMVGASYAEKGSDLESALMGAHGDFGKAIAGGNSKVKSQAAGALLLSGAAQNQTAAEALANEIAAVSSNKMNEAAKFHEQYKKHTDGDAAMTVALSTNTIEQLAKVEATNAPAILKAFQEAMSHDLSEMNKNSPAGVEQGQFWTVQLIRQEPAPSPSGNYFNSLKSAGKKK